MSKRRYELDTRVLAVFFFVAIPFVALGAFMVINRARHGLLTAMGSTVEQRAQQAQELVERYVVGQYIHLHLLSLDPQVREAVNAPPRTATNEEARRLDQAWGAGDATLAASIVQSPLASRLRELGQVHPGLKLLQVIDSQGRLLASTVRGGRLWNGDTTWFRAVADAAAGGRPYFIDIGKHHSGGSPTVEMAYPVRDATGRYLGAVRALFDANDLGSALAPARLGRTGRAVLVRGEDGLILASDETSRILKDRFDAFGYIQTAQREQKAYWVVPDAGPQGQAERVVGFSRVAQVPAVNWVVAVEQDLSEGLAPVQGASWYLLLHFLAVFGAALLLALFVSFRLEAPVIEEELHLHEEHVPASYRAAS